MDIGNRSIPICGDIRIDVFHKDLFKKERMLVIWFNTYFVERGVTFVCPNGGGVREVQRDEDGGRILEYTIDKPYIDKANKDKKDKLFPSDFQVRLNLSIPPREPERKVSASKAPASTSAAVPTALTPKGTPKGSVKVLNNRNENFTCYVGENERSKVINERIHTLKTTTTTATTTTTTTTTTTKDAETSPTKPLDCSVLNKDFNRLCVDDKLQNRLSRSIEDFDLIRYDGREYCSDDETTDDDEITI